MMKKRSTVYESILHHLHHTIQNRFKTIHLQEMWREKAGKNFSHHIWSTTLDFTQPKRPRMTTQEVLMQQMSCWRQAEATLRVEPLQGKGLKNIEQQSKTSQNKIKQTYLACYSSRFASQSFYITPRSTRFNFTTCWFHPVSSGASRSASGTSWGNVTYKGRSSLRQTRLMQLRRWLLNKQQKQAPCIDDSHDISISLYPTKDPF